ncbi:hypothetical protein ASE70_15030 [Sphingomonas sp. Leaf22]|uniref:hypothetical protein n=1 Tax=Sphingomonas sp. Leaf22 TaxID=1735687 RepID=UPI0006F68485|nr:hypothetical protein [Sphingomonas sp. Leaf22]KQM92225.1 hypothetical protein ASE70_15030 [Sphingomonas sp. Leaf22]
MKFVSLLTSAYVGGNLRHPHEGALHVEDAEAEKLVADGVATDVSDDFTAKQDKATPVETIAAPGGSEAPAAPENPHQVEVAPQVAEADAPEPKQSRRKAAADKE